MRNENKYIQMEEKKYENGEKNKEIVGEDF